MENGLSNSRFFTIAPVGTESLIMNNCSSGIEPAFALEQRRKILDHVTGKEVEDVFLNYAYALYLSLPDDKKEKDWKFITTKDVTAEQHLNMQAVWQENIDSSISKTIIIKTETPFEDVEDSIAKAYKLGIKGCTFFRSNPNMMGILSDASEIKKKRRSRGK